MLPVLGACNYPVKFNKEAWVADGDPAAPPSCREHMLDDLIKHHKLEGLTCAQLRDSLGDPNFQDASSYGYDIAVDYGSDIDPVYIKGLNFYFSKDSVITSFEVHETGDRPFHLF